MDYISTARFFATISKELEYLWRKLSLMGEQIDVLVEKYWLDEALEV